MVCSIASVAKKEDVLPLAGVAYGARVGGFLSLFLGVFGKPLPGIELGGLLLVLDLDAFNGRTCIEDNGQNTGLAKLDRSLLEITQGQGASKGLGCGRGYVPDTPSRTRSFRNASRQIGQVFVFWAHNRMHES